MAVSTAYRIEPFPVVKRLQPDLVLHLINRGLVVTSKVLARVSTDNIILNAFLPEIHQSLLKTLDALLFCANEHMLSYAPIICKIILNVLQWTQDIDTPTHRIIRFSAYETLISWMKVSSLSSFIEQHTTEIILSILFDITPKESKVKLENMKAANNEKREEHRGVQELHSFYGFGESKEKLCCIALQCFRKVMSSSGIFMKPTMQKNLQRTLADLLLRLQNGQNNDTIYNKSVKCRKLLYQIFFSLVLHPSSRFPPPTHEAVIIFSQGKTDCDHDISDLCSEVLCTIKKIIQTNSLNRDENKGLVLNNQEEESDKIPNDTFLVPPVEEPIVLDSTDLSASDAEMDTKEICTSQESIETLNNSDVLPNSQTSVSSAEPVIITSVNNCNGTATNNVEEDDDGPLLVIPNDDEDTAKKVDEIPEVPIKRQKLAEDVVLPSCEEIVAAVKQQNHDKENDVQEAKGDEMVLENNSLFKIEKVETVSVAAFDDSKSRHDSSTISEKLADNSVGNLSVEEMMSSFVSEINDDI
ncbi:proline-, glutamic acid- and leucine-rich protein 1-like [Ctenocephalides felis]|uniref:proline-, glutamic acid- and leucine-rich protein 1-like n=1 Tax=Ctenocephalides felis TaxID=7515 RepID=UPI000E6E439F|nr:proline-, glutamic acid- and leucine-rich protein 1-like [Ctenocephalides felis]